MQILKCQLKYSKSVLVQAIGQGQYEFDKGIIFGGKEFQQENILAEKALKAILPDYQKILIVDLHTGFGKRGELQLFNAPKILDEVKKQVNSLFLNRVVADDDANFYKENGSFLDFVFHLCSEEQRCFPIMFEFGTFNSHTIAGALKTLKIMVDENQSFHYGHERAKDSEWIDKYFLEMFYPSDKQWRTTIIEQFCSMFPIIFKNFQDI